ncbi:hypothetical protein NFI96_016566 [Prochilodus magdalenae]|nr:hypothetical protein NFI96_016566 [Prochilodus magdalenae]
MPVSVDASEVDASEVDASEVDASEVDVSEVDASEVDASEVDASEVDVSQVDASEVDASEAKSPPIPPQSHKSGSDSLHIKRSLMSSPAIPHANCWEQSIQPHHITIQTPLLAERGSAELPPREDGTDGYSVRTLGLFPVLDAGRAKEAAYAFTRR